MTYVRRVRNLVTFRYNMAVWLLDTMAMTLAGVAMTMVPEYFEQVIVLTVLVTCGINPALYLAPIKE